MYSGGDSLKGSLMNDNVHKHCLMNYNKQGLKFHLNYVSPSGCKLICRYNSKNLSIFCKDRTCAYLSEDDTASETTIDKSLCQVHP